VSEQDEKLIPKIQNPSRKSIILIVDDNEYGRDIIKRLLIVKGYQLAFAGNGVEALTKAAQLTPDLILLDVMMPGMDGFEVCRRLRQDPILAEVPIIMLTALDEPQARMRGIEAGADDFISKPFDRDELRARVQTIIRLNRFRRLMLERTKFEWVVENADDAYLVVDDDDYILYTNSRARLYLGWDIKSGDNQLLAEKFLDIVKRQYTCEPEELWNNWPKLPENNSPRYLLRPESGQAPTFWLQVDILNLTEPQVNPIIRLRDVTDQMNLERDMRGFHEMVRHKLRTPLLGMLNNLELLAKHGSKMPGEEVTRFAQIAFQSASRLKEQINDVLQYLHAPNLVNTEERFPFALFVINIKNMAETLGIKQLEILGQDGLGNVQFLVSPRTLEVIISEILENAKKFHPQKEPTVTVYVARAGVNKLNVQICDDGIYLSPEQLAKAWTPYYQGEKYFTGEVSGMGLGLSLVALLVREAGGMYAIANRQDRVGVIVEFTLPIEERTELERLNRLTG